MSVHHLRLMNSKKIVFLLAAGLVLSLAQEASAGWYSRRAAFTIGAVPLGTSEAPAFGQSYVATFNTHYALINTLLSSNELAMLKLYRPFTNLSDADAQTRFAGTRRAVLDAIDALSLDDPCLGDGLLQLYGNRRISLAFGYSRYPDAELREDGSGEFGDEAMNLYDFPCPPTGISVKLYDRDMVRLIQVLGHEGRHLVQDGYPGPEPTTLSAMAAWALTNQNREVSALMADLFWMSSLQAVLESITNNLTLPANAKGSPWRIGNTILTEPGLTATQRRDIALGLWGLTVGKLKPRTTHVLNFRLTYRTNLQYYLSGQIASPNSYNTLIKKTGWFSYSDYQRTGEFRYITGYGGAGQFTAPPSPQYVGDPTLWQIGTRSNGTKFELSFSVPLNYLSDAWRWSNNLIVAGDDEPTQQGVLRGYLDTTGDGIVNQASARELMRSPEFYGGLKLEYNFSSQSLWGFNRRTAQLFQFTGSDADGFPTGKVARGSLNLRPDLMDFHLARDTTWAVGLPDYDTPIGKYSRSVLSKWNTTSLQFTTYRVGVDFKEVGVNAALGSGLRVGDNRIYATATPGWTCMAYRWDGAVKTPLATAQADPNGHMVFDLGSDLQAGNRIIVGSEIAGWWSPTYTVAGQTTPQLFQPRVIPGNRVQLQVYGTYRAPHTFLRSGNLSTWQEDGTFTSSRFGNSFNKEMLDGPAFWRVREDAKPLTAVPDFYEIAPGQKSEFHPSYNDIFRKSTGFEVVNVLPNLHTDRFDFEVSGKFKFVATTLDLNFALQYRMFNGAAFSSPAAVNISRKYEDLVKPRVERDTNGVDIALVPCLVFSTNHYPTYQFYLSNNTNDVCKPPHWHTPGYSAYPLESPTAGKPDPDQPNCGHGTEAAVSQVIFRVPLSDFDAFKILHIPPI